MADNGDDAVHQAQAGSRPDRLSALSPSKRELLRKLLSGQVVLPGDPPPVEENRDRHARATYQQDAVFKGGHQINLWLTIHLSGRLSVSSLQWSLKHVLERHEILRSTIYDDGGAPRILVWNLEDEEWWSFHDLRSEGAGRGAEIAEALIRGLSAEPFKPSVAPLFKVALFSISDTSHILHFLIDHLIFDGWSSQVLLDELTNWYNHFEGTTPAPAPLPLQYSDYARAQRATLTGERRQRYALFWSEHLRGIARRPSDPLARPDDREALTFALSKAALEQLQREAAQHRVSVFTLLLTTYGLALADLEGTDLFAIAIASANRSQAGLEKLIGLFSNMMPTPIDLRGDVTLGDAARRLGSACMSTIGHQDAPPHWLRDELAELQAARGPYANHSFILQNYPLPSLVLQDIEARTLGADYGIGAKMDIDLLIVPEADGWKGVLEFRADRYSRTDLKKLLVRMFAVAGRFGDLAHLGIGDIDDHIRGGEEAMAGLCI